MDDVGKDLDRIRNDIDAIRNDMEVIRNNIERLTPSEDIQIGQLAYKLERSIIDEVLGQERAKELYIYSIRNLKDVLERENNDLKNEEEHNLANKKWSVLKRRLGWNLRHCRCLEYIKNQYFYPQYHCDSLSTDKVREALRNPKYSHFKNNAEQLLSMYDVLQDDKLMVGQLGVEIERAIISKLLPPEAITYYRISSIERFKEVLSDHDYQLQVFGNHEPSLEKMLQDWNDMQKRFKIDLWRLTGVIRFFRYRPNSTAPPQFDLQRTREIVSEGYFSDDKRDLEELITLYENLALN